MKRKRKPVIKLLSLMLALAVTVSGISIPAYASELELAEEVVSEVSSEEETVVEESDETTEDDDLEETEEITNEESLGDTIDEAIINGEESFTIVKELDEEEIEGETELVEEIQVQVDRLNSALDRGTDTTPVSRGEWLGALLDSFGYSFDESMYGDEYFPDINSENVYYNEVMSAVVLGLSDVEAGDNFNADAICTREYAVFTLNKFLGFDKLSESYTFAESDSVTYKDDIQAAVDREWFELVDNKFLPDTAITKADMDALLRYGYEVCHQFEDDEDEGFEFADEVINLDELGIEHEIAETDENLVHTYRLSNIPEGFVIKSGDIFGFIDSGMPFAKKVLSVTESGNELLVYAENADSDVAFKKASISGVSSVSLATLIPVDDYMEYDYIVGGSVENQFEDGQVYDTLEEVGDKNISAVEITQHFDALSKKKIKGTSLPSYKGKYLTISVKLTELEVTYGYKVDKFVSVALSGKLIITAKAEADILGELDAPTSYVLGVLPMGEFGQITLSAEWSLKAALTVTQIENFIVGVEVSSASGARVIGNMYEDSASNVKTEVQMSIGLKLSYDLNYYVLYANMYAKAGVAGRVENAKYGVGAPQDCLNIKTWFYYKSGWSFGCRLGVDLFSEKKDIETYNEFSSPYLTNYHYEDGVEVETCTRPEDWKAQKGSSIKYYTGKMSKYRFGSTSGTSGGGTIQTYEFIKASDGTAIITKFNGNSSTLNIPETVDGEDGIKLTVTQVGNGSNIIPNDKRSMIRSVFIPNAVKKIGNNAFGSCISLSTVNFSDNLIEIGNNAFEKCSSLRTLTFPEGLTTIGRDAFLDCTSLSSVNIPLSLTNVNSYGIFTNCTNLDGDGVVFADNITTITGGLFRKSCIETIKLPETITSIGSNAFYSCNNLKTITLPNAVINIGNSSFAYCNSLVEVVFSEELNFIDNHAFDSCTSLKEVILPKKLEKLGSSGYGMCFQNCSSLEKVFIPKSLTTVSNISNLNDGMFANCPLLDGEDFEFEEGVTQIPSFLFSNTSIKTITIPDTVTSIGYAAFRSCDNLTSIKLPEKLETIGGWAFRDCPYLTDIQIPDNVTSIGESMFLGCTYLNKFPFTENSKVKEFPNSVFEQTKNIKEAVIPTAVESMGWSVFANSAIEKVTFNENIETFGYYVFRYCSDLTTVDLSKATKLRRFNNYVFDGCSKLTSIELPNSLVDAGVSTFSGCSSLKTAVIGTGLQSIQSSMFSGCSALESIVVPFRVKEIGSSAFANCSSLKSIVIPANVTKIATNAFSYKSVVIKGVSGSYAETFANDNGYTFEEYNVEVTKITVPEEIRMKLYDTLTVEIAVEPLDFTDAILFYKDDESSNVITIKDSARGTFYADNIGTEKIIVEADSGVYKEITVSVVQPVTSIGIEPYDVSIEGGESKQLVATPYPLYAYNREVIWSIEDDSIASISETGVVTGKKKGTTKARATWVEDDSVYGLRDIVVTSTVNIVENISDFQSQHKYPNNSTEVWIYTVSGASGLEVTFDEQTSIHRTDYLYVYDSTNKEIAKSNGTDLAGKTIEVPGDTVKIKLVAGESLNAWGFAVTNVEAQVQKSTISYVLNGGENSASNPDKVPTGTELTLVDPTKVGYEFEGWYTDAKFTKAWTNGSVVSANITFYAKWKAIEYSITYVMNDSEDEPAVNAAGNPEKYTIESSDITLLKPSRAGYSFAGWFDADDTEVKVISAGSMGDVTLYASWREIPRAGKVEIVVYPLSADGKVTDIEGCVDVTGDAYVVLYSSTDPNYIYYTLDGTTPSVTSTLYRGPFTVSGSVKISAFATAEGYEDSANSSWSINRIEDMEATGDVSKAEIDETFGGDVTKIPNGIWISGADEELQYDGTVKTFSDLKVYDYKKLLVPGTDYTVVYKNNKNAYTLAEGDTGFVAAKAPQILITGKGAYNAKITKYFKISPIELDTFADGKEGTVSDIYIAYKPGKAQKPLPVVKYGSLTLKKNVDYTFEYRDGADNVVAAIASNETHNLVVCGKGNYAGTLNATIYVIDPDTDSRVLMSTVKATAIPAQNYKADGYSIADVEAIITNPANRVSVTDSKKNTLKLGEDYKVSSVANAELPGKATVVLQARDGSNYVGVKELTFNITGVAITKARFELEYTTVEYSGRANKPAMKTAVLINKDVQTPLTEGVDYKLTYDKNVNAGTATVIITGMGLYTGTKKMSFRITPKSIVEDSDVINILNVMDSYGYEKGGLKPVPSVIYEYSDSDGSSKQRTLVAGKDYSVAYKNNTKLAAIDEVNARGIDIAPQVVITLKGDFSGKLVKRFEIRQKSIASTVVKVADKTYAAKANAWKSNISIVDVNGKVLSAADYDTRTLKYTYTYDVNNVEQYKSTPINVTAGTEIGKNDIPPVGCYITVTAQGKGCYSDTVQGTYKILDANRDIAKAAVKVINPENSGKSIFFYTGKAICPSKDEIEVAITVKGVKTILSPEDYTIVGYSNNVAKGTASVTIKGRGEYGGEKTIKYTIAARSFWDNWINK